MPIASAILSFVWYGINFVLRKANFKIETMAEELLKGKIGVTAENIFPIIKKFLYSEQEIFLRELISNAQDATQKIKALQRSGEMTDELGDLTIRVKIDKDNKTITISDRGIGMTAEEVDKYINQIAFTSANEFLEKYKDKIDSIIGHFGLGFYSSFMVSKKVEIITKSWKKDAPAVRWECDGSPDFVITQADKQDRGTDVILHLDDDAKEYLEHSKIRKLLEKYCRFLPIPIAFGKKTEWKDGKEVETDEDIIINDTIPLWKKHPTDVKDEDYKEFYKKLYPEQWEEPLFWIHLNVDYPFNLTGILYFPHLRSNLEVQKNKIQLYANQVFVTDSVENIVPEFLTLLHGVLDSPDIPLNVSRSYLQTDSNVRKISSHITKKVADKLTEIFKNKREEFEKKWDDLRLFIQYGMLTDNTFYDKVKPIYLFKNVDGKYFSIEEYDKIIKDLHTDKYGKLVYLYATNKTDQYKFLKDAQDKGYDVLLFDGAFDMPFINLLESKLDNVRFARVDSDIIENIIRKEDKKELQLSKEEQDELSTILETAAPSEVGTYFVQFADLGEKELPIVITESEYMRRMKDIGLLGGPEHNLYKNLPNNYNLVANISHPVFKQIVENKNKELGEQLQDLNNQLNQVKADKEALNKLLKNKKEEEISAEEKQQRDELDDKESNIRSQKETLLKQWAVKDKVLKQAIDLALLSKNLLKGESLMNFVRRSVEFIEK